MNNFQNNIERNHLYARKVAQIADSRRHLRRDCGSLTYRRPKKKARKAHSARERTFSRKRPLFMMLLFFVSQYFFLQSPLFQFREIKIEGNNHLESAVFEEKLSLSPSFSYWNLSPESLEESLTSLHRLEDASVSVDFPGQVNVKVSERKPSFFVAYRRDQKHWFSVDETGVVLEGQQPKSGLKFLLPHPIKGGTKVRPKDMQVVRFFEDHVDGPLGKQIRAINISNTRQVSLKVLIHKRPVWVRLGRPERLEYKLFLLSELLGQLAKEKVEIKSIDLRYSAPVVKMMPPKS
ncbi:MAG TPA: FtsQ-type POTRA domain-containing protein [Phycisphaerales bacterium]|nr:FtsQ-type POTRA domain-containing protein [Phycisphaerales bacterium]